MKSYVFISGAAGGVGSAFAAECASRNWNLFLTDIRTEELETVADRLSSTHKVDILTHTCDMTDETDRSRMFRVIKESSLVFHMLVNVAGTEFEGLFQEVSRKQLSTILRLNIESTLDVTHEILPLRDDSCTFRIITVASLAAFYPMPVKAMYSASKRFLLNFFLALREELRDENATVTILCPSGLPTLPRIIKAIEAQGFVGRLSMKKVDYVAEKTVDKALKGKAVYIPGRFNQLLRRIGSLMPQRTLVRLVGRRWISKRK
ncbi:MAG: SDR family NAD(P)-dependent oxidoreductase [Bacteroidetes bacterium]|nr:SDR family NAD(P)-dependent oxidoreductase [Bacteroidota bacterium]